MTLNRLQFKGCYTAIVTPFTPDGCGVDLVRLSEHVRFQAQGGVTGIVPCGTTGESPTLQEAEHCSVIETAIRVGRPLGLQIVAGAGSNNTVHAVHLQKLAHSMGADAALQVTPYYNKPSQEGIYRHFMTVADCCSLPIMLYNIPGRSGVAILPETVERLAKHPNIQSIKEATGSMDSASEIRQRCDITVLSGDDSLTVAFAAVGAVGVVSVVSNLLPDRVSAMCKHLNANNFAAARAEHDALFPMFRGLLSLDTNPVPLKAAMALLGRDHGVVRLPMAPASKDALVRVQELLRRVGLEAAAGAAR
jgi:4-hydroxy-tetrahydrodipicolinate synthase